MKNFTSSIRKKKLKGNVSLLVILILLASSVIALLSISQIQHLITYGDMTFNYFRAFYLAKAGTELGLTEVYNRENGFEDKIENTKNDEGAIVFHEIIENNFLGNEREYEGAKPYFDMEIESNFGIIGDDIRKADCVDENKITLEPRSDTEGQEKPGEGIVFSLFRDNTKGFTNILSGGYVKDIKVLTDDDIKMLKFDKDPDKGDLMFGLFGYNNEGNMSGLIVENPDNNDLNSFLKNNISGVKGDRKYLSIKNVGNEPVSFCIKGNGSIPYSHYLITVRGNYADMEVGLQSVVKKDFPSWSLDVLGWEESS